MLVLMPTKITFVDKNITLDVVEDVDDVRSGLEQQLRAGALVKLERQAPEGTPVWVNPAAVAFIEGAPSRTPHLRAT
jgi:hypothetical protein